MAYTIKTFYICNFVCLCNSKLFSSFSVDFLSIPTINLILSIKKGTFSILFRAFHFTNSPRMSKLLSSHYVNMYTEQSWSSRDATGSGEGELRLESIGLQTVSRKRSVAGDFIIFFLNKC